MTAFKAVKYLADIGRIIAVSCSTGSDDLLTKRWGAPGAVTLCHVYRIISHFRNFCDVVSADPRPRHCHFQRHYQHHRVGVEGHRRRCPGGGNGHIVDAGGDHQPTSLAVVIVLGCGGHWHSCLDIADGTGSDRHRQRSSTVRG